jgi:hypothetical protein
MDGWEESRERTMLWLLNSVDSLHHVTCFLAPVVFLLSMEVTTGSLGHVIYKPDLVSEGPSNTACLLPIFAITISHLLYLNYTVEIQVALFVSLRRLR